MVKGEGCYLWDLENHRYLDFTAGIAVNSLGHADSEMVKLLAQQVECPFYLGPIITFLISNTVGQDIDTCIKSLSQPMDG